MMGTITKIDGICPAVFTIYKDETCREVDLDAWGDHLRTLVQCNLGALILGGHAGEIPALTSEERRTMIRLARDIAGGSMPVVGGIVADSTREAIHLGHEAKDAGAEAVLFTPPSIPGWNTATDARFLVEHFAAFEREVGLPIIIFGAPNPAYGGMFNVSPQTIAEVVRSVESIVACKITADWHVGSLRRVVNAIKSVRDIGLLKAGAANTFASFVYGANGNLSGAANFRAADDIAILEAVRAGDYIRAQGISDSWNEVTDLIYGAEAGLPVVYFHYRYKIVAWLMGAIERPEMRRPQLPPPLHEIELLREALIRSDKPVVREAREIAIAAI
jgi:4-hydroxy-tetrahydrodipicolinate synthase